jgi:hypothetical protein
MVNGDSSLEAPLLEPLYNDNIEYNVKKGRLECKEMQGWQYYEDEKRMSLVEFITFPETLKRPHDQQCAVPDVTRPS